MGTVDEIYDYFDMLIEQAADTNEVVDALRRRREAFDKIGAVYNPQRTRPRKAYVPRDFVTEALLEMKG